MRGREISNQQVGYSNLEHLNSFIFFVEFLLHKIGNLIKTVAAFLASVSKLQVVVEQMREQITPSLTKVFFKVGF